MKRVKSATITSFFSKKQNRGDLENQSDSIPCPSLDKNQSDSNPSLDNSKTSTEEPIVSETETRSNLDSSQEPVFERLAEFDIISLPKDPGLRRKLTDFHINDRDIIIREYIRRGPCQPRSYDFPRKQKRRFVPSWLDEFKSWLEYSTEKDAAFCFVCYLFKGGAYSGGDAFVNEGFKTWSKTSAFHKHIGNHMSTHNIAMRSLAAFEKQNSSIVSCFETYSTEVKNDYRIRLEVSIQALRYICLQGLASRGHDESDKSLNQGNFLELVKLIAKRDINAARVVLKNAPGNCILTSPPIQKDIISVFAKETGKKIIEELDGGFFAILADESADIVDKEWMALCLRFVDKMGQVKERLLGIVHVGDTTSLTLKAAIESLLTDSSLTLSSVRGQGYDGASNMRGAINGLKTLILKESQSAYYVHCFAHQLQLTLVAVAKKNVDCCVLLESLSILLNMIGGSSKRKDILREKQAEHVLKGLEIGELVTGSGLNQEKGLNRPGDTRWGSHFRTILNVFALFSSILDVLDAIGDFCDSSERVKVEKLSYTMQTFDFVFIGQLMITVFGITNDLSLVLQKKDQDIVNAMDCVDATRRSLQKVRDNGWDTHLKKVSAFCVKHKIHIPSMNDAYIFPGRYKRGRKEVSNLHHFRVEVFLSLVDQISQEIDNRFDEVSKELLICMSCFNPKDRFSSFDTSKLLRLAEFYPSEFSSVDLLHFEFQLGNYIEDIRHDDRFWNLKNLTELSMKLVETKKHLVHSKVYLLLKLVLILPVATATVERVFSALTHIKNKVRNSMGDQLLNDNLLVFIERDLFSDISDDAIVNHFQNMRTRRLQLD